RAKYYKHPFKWQTSLPQLRIAVIFIRLTSSKILLAQIPFLRNLKKSTIPLWSLKLLNPWLKECFRFINVEPHRQYKSPASIFAEKQELLKILRKLMGNGFNLRIIQFL